MQVIILGDGGHSKVIQEMIQEDGRLNIIAILDDKYEAGYQKHGIIHAPISYTHHLMADDTKVVVAIGDNQIRNRLVRELNLPDICYLSVQHHTAVVSKTAKIAPGTVLMAHTTVNAHAKIDSHCIINTASVIEHDTDVGAFTHVSPNATLTGNVSTGEGVHIGSSATVIPGKHLGSWSIIGAGSTVIEHIPAYSKAVGSPTRIIERMLIK